MRIWTIIALVIFLLIHAAIPIYGEETDFGQAEILEALPNEVGEILAEKDISPDNGGALNLSVSDIFEYIWDLFKSEVTKPLRMLLSLIGVTLLLALAESMQDSTGSSQAVAAFNLVGVIAGAAMISASVSECVIRTTGTLSGAGTFLCTFIPVFAGIMAVTGQLATAGVFSTITMVAAQIFSQAVTSILSPLCCCILGVSVAGSVSPDLKVGQLAEMIKKVVVWALGLMVTIFVGLLSVQSMITTSADGVTAKAAKFVVSNSVPIVGSAIGDALATVNGSVGIIRSSTGTFGIIAGVVLMLPNIVSVVLYKIALELAAGVSELFSLSRLSGLLKSGQNVMSIILAMMTSFMLLTVVSIAIMLLIGQGVRA